MATRRPPLIRTATQGDLGAVLDVYDEDRSTEPTPTEVTTWQRMLGTEDLHVYCAEVDGRVVGTAMLLVMPNLTYQCAPTAFIEAVVVRAAHRRQGLATAMLERMLTDARAQGCNKVQLLSHKRHAQDGAHGLYARLGFEAEAEGFRRYLGPVPPKVLAARTAS